MNNKVYRHTFRKAKLVLLIICILLFAYILYYRFGYTEKEKITKFYEQNINSFELLKNEVLKENSDYKVNKISNDSIKIIQDRLYNSDNRKIITHHELKLLKSDKSFNLSRVKENNIIDSLKRKLDITHIGMSQDNESLIIYFETNFNNYIGTFEYWYCKDGLEEVSWKDGPALKKINNNWGIYRVWGTYWGIFKLSD